MNKLFALLAVAALLFAFGCAGLPASPSSPQNGNGGNGGDATGPAPSTVYIGGNADTHGCQEQDGYFWCKIKDKCINIREEKCQYDPPPSGTTGVSAEGCAHANGTVVDGTDCPFGTYSAASILDSGMAGKICCRPEGQT